MWPSRCAQDCLARQMRTKQRQRGGSLQRVASSQSSTSSQRPGVLATPCCQDHPSGTSCRQAQPRSERLSRHPLAFACTYHQPDHRGRRRERSQALQRKPGRASAHRQALFRWLDAEQTHHAMGCIDSYRSWRLRSHEDSASSTLSAEPTLSSARRSSFCGSQPYRRVVDCQ